LVIVLKNKGLFDNFNQLSIYGKNFVKLNMDWKERIVSDKNILLGKPVIKGTRLSVEHILDRLANGWSEEMILESYPFISKDDILAVFS